MPDKKARSAREATALGAAVLGSMLEESSSILAVATGRSDHVVCWNRAAEDFFGKLARQVMGKTLTHAVGAKVARQLRAALKAPTGQVTQVLVEDKGPPGARRLYVECVSASPSTTTVFLATTLHEAGATLKPSQEVQHMVRVGGRYHAAGAVLRSPKDLAEEGQWLRDELETLNEELQGVNDELSACEEAYRRGIRRSMRSETLLRQVIDAASRPFILCDSDNVVVIWNAAAVRRYGLSSRHAVGKELFGLVPAFGRAAMRAASLRACKPGASGASTWTQDGTDYLVHPIAARAGKRRHYLLRVGGIQ